MRQPSASQLRQAPARSDAWASASARLARHSATTFGGALPAKFGVGEAAGEAMLAAAYGVEAQHLRSAPPEPMDQVTHNRIVSFLWGIADDVLRDLFKRGKYPDVILPMCVLRRLDAVLESTKAKVLEAKQKLDAAEIKEQDAALRAAAGQAFYNISPFVLRDLTSRGSAQQLRADFEAYLEGFSDNVQDILDNFSSATTSPPCRAPIRSAR